MPRMHPFLSCLAFLPAILWLGLGSASASKGDCGQPITFGEEPTASDALGVLRAAVGTSECENCVCDVDASGSVQATDALRTLRFAVGTLEDLDCLSCRVEETIGTAGGVLESDDGRVTLNVSEGQLDEDTELFIEEVPTSELPAALEALAEKAYRLGPDDVEFNSLAELDVLLGDDPAQMDGTLAARLALLFTVDGGTVELLPVQQMFVDGDAGRITAGAAISHFSILALVRVDVVASLASIPESSGIGVDREIDAAVSEDAGETFLEVDGASYSDTDFGAWAPIAGDISADTLEPLDADTFTDSYTYECTGTAAVSYRPQIHTTFDITADVAGMPQDVSHLTVFETTIVCQ